MELNMTIYNIYRAYIKKFFNYVNNLIPVENRDG